MVTQYESGLKIFFLHNPKAGGTSLRSLFAAFFQNRLICPVITNGPNDHKNKVEIIDDFFGFDYYSGHYGYDVYQRLCVDHALITNFRDPVQRIYSLYRYWRNNVSIDSLINLHISDAEVVKLAHALPFSYFIRSDNRHLRLYMDNFHYRQLYNSCWDWAPLNEITTSIVKSRIALMPWFYIAETPNISNVLLGRAFCELAGIEIPWLNESSGSVQEICGTDVEYLMRRNSFDYEIYTFALQLQEARAKQLG